MPPCPSSRSLEFCRLRSSDGIRRTLPFDGSNLSDRNQPVAAIFWARVWIAAKAAASAFQSLNRYPQSADTPNLIKCRPATKGSCRNLRVT